MSNKTKVIVVACMLLFILTAIFIIFFARGAKVSESTPVSSTSTSSISSTISTAKSIATPSSQIIDENAGVDTVEPVDSLIDSLPAQQGEFTLFYSYDNNLIVIHVDAREKTDKATRIEEEIKEYFLGFGVTLDSTNYIIIYKQ